MGFRPRLCTYRLDWTRRTSCRSSAWQIYVCEICVHCCPIYICQVYCEDSKKNNNNTTSALHHIIPGHWICSFMWNFNSPGSIQHCSHVTLGTSRITIAISVPPGTHLHLSEVKHLWVKYLAQGHNINTTMSQC